MSFRFLTTKSRFYIKDISLPSCINCKYFIPSTTKCMMFGYKDRVSGEIINHSADVCRNDTSMCDKNGFYYDQKPTNST